MELKKTKKEKRAPTQHINFEISRFSSLSNLSFKSFCVGVARRGLVNLVGLRTIQIISKKHGLALKKIKTTIFKY